MYRELLLPLLNLFAAMNHIEKNDYVETMKPILFLSKMVGVLPYPSAKKNGLPKFLTCKITWAIVTMVYLLNMGMVFEYMSERLYKLSEDFSMKRVVDTVLRSNSRTIVLSISLNMWNKTEKLSNYWDKWKALQNQYEQVSGEPFVSKVKTHVKWVTLICTLVSLWGQFLGQVYRYHGTIDLKFFSENFVYTTLYIVGTYWYANCLYIRSVAENITDLGKKVITKGDNPQDLYKVFELWMKLCDLSDEFNTTHSLLFFFFFTNVNVAFIFFAYVSMNHSTYEDIINRTVQATGLTITSTVIFMICETGYSIYERINLNPKQMLLKENTMHLNRNMLQAVLFFLQMTHVRKPKFSLNGLVVLNRSLFVAIWATGINYLIVLRQFSSTGKN